MVVLLPHQHQHVDRLESILSTHACALDCSLMGAGKTYTTVALAARLNFAHVVVVCPVAVQAKWEQLRQRYPKTFRLHSITSYATLRSPCARHGLLVAHQQPYGPSPELSRLCREGALFVFDECQHLKNPGGQARAAKAIVQAARPLAQSRVLLLSGSPVDQQRHVFSFLDLMGALPRGKGVCLARWSRSQHRTVLAPETLEFIRICSAIDGPATMAVTGTTLREMMYQLFQRVYRPAVASAMAAPTHQRVRVCKLNAFHDMDTESDDFAQLQRGVTALQRASGYDPSDALVIPSMAGHDAIMAVTAALVTVETAKAGLFARLAREKLDGSPCFKVVIAVNYCKTMEEIAVLLQDFDPLELRGSMCKEAREACIRRFQEDPQRRLLIANLGVCSTGIDLDDKVGDAPRLCLASPTYSTINLHQLGYRFMRADTRSDAFLHMVYVREACEQRVLQALQQKSKVMAQTTPEQSAAGVVFPGSFVTYDPSLGNAQAATIQAAWRAWHWRKHVRDNPHTELGHRWLRMVATRECAR